MTDDVIFVKQGDDLVPLAVSDYEAEAVLQALLERYPQLLAGAQMNRRDPRRFLLVRREAPIADSEGGAARWSIDHLFLDQDGIPTLVEVKRSSDTRIRREVVGQMLDYAANGIRYWAPDQLQAFFEKTCAESRKDPTAELFDVIGERDIDQFWVDAGRNLRDGRLRLVFVADVIPDELRSVIEFLNSRLLDTEVYGVEVRRYAAQSGQESFVPRLIGALANVDVAKGTGSSTSLDALFAKAGTDAMEVRDRIASWASEHALPTVNAPGSFQVGQAKGRGGRGALVRVYPTFRTLEIPMVSLWETGRDSEISDIVARIQQISPGKPVAEKNPSIRVGDALSHWEEVVAILNRVLEVRDMSTAALPST